MSTHTRKPRTRGTILMTIGALILAFIAFSVYSGLTFNFAMFAITLVGVIVAGVGASQRFERP